MPIIPRLQTPGPLANAPAPVLDRNQRPTMDTRGVQGALRQFTEANKAPLMNPDALSAPYEALGSVGRAIAQAGDVVGALAIKRQEAETDIQIAQTDSRMEMETADFENWKAGQLNKPETWQKEWESRLGRVRQEITGNQALNSQARQQIELRLTRWQGQSVAGVAKDATKQTFDLARSVFVANAQSAIQSGDEARFQETVKTGVSKGYFFPHVASSLEEQFRGEQIRRADKQADNFLAGPKPDLAKAKEAINQSPLPAQDKKLKVEELDRRYSYKIEEDSLLNLAQTEPKSAIELAYQKEESGAITGMQRANIEGEALQNQAFRLRTAVTEYRERIALKDKPSAEELDNDPRLNDFARMSIAQMVDGQVNDPKEYQSALTGVMSFNPSAFKDDRERITATANF